MDYNTYCFIPRPVHRKKTLHVNKEVPDDFSQSHVTFIKKPYFLCLSPLIEEK